MSTEPPEAPYPITAGLPSRGPSAPPPRECFVISPIGDRGSPERKRADQVKTLLIEPAAQAQGYTRVLRADDIQEPGMITNQVIKHILEAEMVVADLSERNPNVFYELSLRHAFRKPVVLIVSSGWISTLPFDVNPARVIIYDLTDWSSPQECIKKLIEHMKAPVGTNPISEALDSLHLRVPEGGDTSVIPVLQALIDQVQTLSIQVSRSMLPMLPPLEPGLGPYQIDSAYGSTAWNQPGSTWNQPADVHASSMNTSRNRGYRPGLNAQILRGMNRDQDPLDADQPNPDPPSS